MASSPHVHPKKTGSSEFLSRRLNWSETDDNHGLRNGAQSLPGLTQ